MLDNIEIAILTRLNALAERHGLKPYDFVATVHSSSEPEEAALTLRFEVFAHGSQLRVERFDRMLADLGAVHGDEAVLAGDAAHVIDALDAALDRAPKPRGLF